MAGGNMYEGVYEVTDGKGDTLYLGRMEGGKLGRLYGLPWSAEAVEQLTEELARKNPENTGAIGGEDGRSRRWSCIIWASVPTCRRMEMTVL